MSGLETVVVIASFVVGILVLGFAIPLIATAHDLWWSRLDAWKRSLAAKHAQLPQQAEIERLADELTEARAEIQRLRTEKAERGWRR